MHPLLPILLWHLGRHAHGLGSAPVPDDWHSHVANYFGGGGGPQLPPGGELAIRPPSGFQHPYGTLNPGFAPRRLPPDRIGAPPAGGGLSNIQSVLGRMNPIMTPRGPMGF